MAGSVTLEVVTVDKPADMNVIIGQAHFIKTVEDLHEAPALRRLSCEQQGEGM